MAGVFLSYSRADHGLAEQVIQGLRRVGVDVWWDQDMPGVDWQEELERKLNSMTAILVLWTASSSASKYVRDEARLGLHSEKLVNVLAGVASPPFPFDRLNGLVLDGWDGREPHQGWSRVIETIEALAAQAGGAPAGELSARLARNEQDLQARRQAQAEAQHAFQDAQIAESEAEEAAREATNAHQRAEEDLGRVGEMRVAPAILHAAQQELGAARAAKDEAIRAHRDARGRLGEASRQLSRATAELDQLLAGPGGRPAVRGAEAAASPGAAAQPAPAPPDQHRAAPSAAARVEAAAPAAEAASGPLPPAAPASRFTPEQGLIFAGIAVVMLLLVAVVVAAALMQASGSPSPQTVAAASLAPAATPPGATPDAGTADAASAAWDQGTYNSCVPSAEQNGAAPDGAQRYCACVVAALDQLGAQRKEALTPQSPELYQASVTCRPQAAAAAAPATSAPQTTAPPSAGGDTTAAGGDAWDQTTYSECVPSAEQSGASPAGAQRYCACVVAELDKLGERKQTLAASAPEVSSAVTTCRPQAQG